MEMSEKIDEITKAMCSFQSKLCTISKDTKAYNYKYSTLDSIVESFRPLLEEHGIAIFQDVYTDDQGVKVVTKLCHISGQWIETSPLLIPMLKRDAHSTGSAASYGRRYSLSALLGIVTSDDDDGQAAQKHAPAQKQNVVQKKTALSEDEWLDKWSKLLGEDDFTFYLNSRAAHFDHSFQTTINQLMKDDSNLHNAFNIWIKKREVKNEV